MFRTRLRHCWKWRSLQVPHPQAQKNVTYVAFVPRQITYLDRSHSVRRHHRCTAPVLHQLHNFQSWGKYLFRRCSRSAQETQSWRVKVAQLRHRQEQWLKVSGAHGVVCATQVEVLDRVAVQPERTFLRTGRFSTLLFTPVESMSKNSCSSPSR